MSRRIMTIKPFQRYGRTVAVGSYMNVDLELYTDLVLRQRVAVTLERYKELKNDEERQRAVEQVEEIETAAERIAEAEKADSVQHVVIHHRYNEEEE